MAQQRHLQHDRHVASALDPELAARRLPRRCAGPDRVPLLALLRATPLTEDQVKEVVRNITADGSTALADGKIGEDEIAAFIKDVSHHDAGPENVQRVAAKLAAAGWPLAGVGDVRLAPQRSGVDDEAVPHVAGEHALVGLVDVIGRMTSISGRTSCSAQKSSISWVSAMPPIIEPERLRRCDTSGTTGTVIGCSGMPSSTRVPSVSSRLM